MQTLEGWKNDRIGKNIWKENSILILKSDQMKPNLTSSQNEIPRKITTIVITIVTTIQLIIFEIIQRKIKSN